VSVSPALFSSLRDGIHARSFTPTIESRPQVGAEVELIAYDTATNLPMPLLAPRRGLVELLRRHAPRLGWTELPGYGPVPRFDIRGRASVSFEPGGQIEISTIPQMGA
jgi:gamma-glutamylcysteine synthetase